MSSLSLSSSTSSRPNVVSIIEAALDVVNTIDFGRNDNGSRHANRGGAGGTRRHERDEERTFAGHSDVPRRDQDDEDEDSLDDSGRTTTSSSDDALRIVSRE
jgi:hypothetical protein